MDVSLFRTEGIILLLCCLCVTAQPPPPITETGLFPYGLENRDAKLTKGNDISSLAIKLRWGMPFNDKKYWTLYVNDNGIVSFKDPAATFPPASITNIDFPLAQDVDPYKDWVFVAPFFADVDITNGGEIFYRQSNEKDLMERCDRAVHRYFVERSNYKTKFMVIATWKDVSFYGYFGGAAPVNTFQVVLATDEFETFAFFRYAQIMWVSSRGIASTGLGGELARVGFNNGVSSRRMEVGKGSDSDTRGLQKLPTRTNNEEIGMYMFHISRFRTVAPDCSDGTAKTYPKYDSMLGHSWLLVSGPCFDRTREHWIRFGNELEPKAIENCTYHSKWMVYCFTPRLFEIGQVDISVSVNDGLTWPHTGTFDVVKIGDTPQRVTRINPDSEAWLRADRPVTIEWDPSLINFTQVRIDVLAYTEPIDPDTGEPGQPDWEEIDEVSYTVENTGRYTWTSRAVSQVTDRNCVGVIRVTRRFKRDDLALWSDLHFLGYIMNDKFQNDPATYSNLRCEEFYEREDIPKYTELKNNLRPCPCNLTQALADRGRFKPDPLCNMDDAVQDRTQEYCRFRDDVVHCVTTIVPSSNGHDSTCCYDEFENLVYAGDSSSGSFSRWATVEGIPPYNAPGKVPLLSSGIADLAPYYMCCIWGDHCDYYQERRPTRDCSRYDVVRPGTVFGDPHFLTLDGVAYTFNAKGEFILLETMGSSPNRFTLQGRFEQIYDKHGVIRRATVLTAVGMQQEDGDKVTIRKTDRNVLEVLVNEDNLEPQTQTTIRRNGYLLTFPSKDEKGNLTQIIVTYMDTEIAVVVNGTQEMLTAQVLVPFRFKNYVTGLLGTWDDNKENDMIDQTGNTYSPRDDPEVLLRNFGQSWEIDSDETLFIKQHSDFQDNSFVPDFVPPTDVELSVATDLQRICGDNQFCEYDLMTTGNIELAKATMLAYKQHWLAYGASFNILTCNYLKTPKNGTKRFLRKRNHQVGAEVEFECEDDFILVGSPYRVCEPPQIVQGEKPRGKWSGLSEDNDCVASLICGGLKTPKYGSIVVEGPPENMKVTYFCDENYKLYGRKVRYCNTEKERWMFIAPYCNHKLNPVEIVGVVIGSITAFVALVIFIAICCILQFRSRRRKAQFPGNVKSKKEKKRPKTKRQQEQEPEEATDYGSRERKYPFRDTPVEIKHSRSELIGQPEEDPYARQMRQKLQQRPQYTNVNKPSPHSSQTLPFPEKDPFPSRTPPPEMISPAEPRYGYADPESAYPVEPEEIEMELKHGKSLESWA